MNFIYKSIIFISSLLFFHIAQSQSYKVKRSKLLQANTLEHDQGIDPCGVGGGCGGGSSGGSSGSSGSSGRSSGGSSGSSGRSSGGSGGFSSGGSSGGFSGGGPSGGFSGGGSSGGFVGSSGGSSGSSSSGGSSGSSSSGGSTGGDEDNEDPKIPWYLDKDGDGYHSSQTTSKESPGDQWKTTTKGKDCFDNDINKTTDCANNDPNDCNSFNKVVAKVLSSEGGFVNDPADPGGATNKGISWPVWTAQAKSVLNKEPTLQNLKDLTTNDANKIYKKLYWDKVKADDIIDGDLRFLLFDFNVNAGRNAVKVLQRTYK